MYSGGGQPGTSAPGGPSLRSAIDAGDNDEILGKLYDSRMVYRLFKYLARVKKYLGLGMIGVVIRTGANLVTPLIVAIAVNRIVANNVDGMTVAALIYLVLLVIIWGAQFIETLYLSYAGQGILRFLRTQMFSHLNNLSISFFDRNKVGKIMSRVQNDVDQLQTLVTTDFINVAINALTLIGIAAIMLVIDWRLALLSLVTLPVLVAVMIVWQSYARRAFIQARRTIADVNDNLQESISGVRVTQGLSREKVNIRRFDAVNKANLDANKKSARLQGAIMPITQILTDASYVIVLVYGGFQVLDGKLAVGFLLAFMLYIQRLSGPIQQLATMYTEIQRAMASGVRIFELLDVAPEIIERADAIELSRVRGEITLNKVRFGYVPGTEVLHGIDLQIKPGQTIAIVGRTGAGKSSIASLITRFYEVTSGEILIDGHNVNSATQQSLHRQTGLVPQDPFLFSGTIEDNIRDGRLDASREDVIAAAREAGIHDFISHLEKGYDTPVGERGINLSAGQRQLICLARVILADPPILILDEATSNVDTNTERIIQKSLQSIGKGRTCLIIAHRLSTVVEADRIIVLDQGRIVEQGTHQELLARKGLYAQMFEKMGKTQDKTGG